MGLLLEDLLWRDVFLGNEAIWCCLGSIPSASTFRTKSRAIVVNEVGFPTTDLTDRGFMRPLILFSGFGDSTRTLRWRYMEHLL